MLVHLAGGNRMVRRDEYCIEAVQMEMHVKVKMETMRLEADVFHQSVWQYRSHELQLIRAKTTNLCPIFSPSACITRVGF